jgi:hypothetical protein
MVVCSGIIKSSRKIAQKLQNSRTIFISPDAIKIPSLSLGFKRGFLFRDPDGHALRIIEK